MSQNADYELSVGSLFSGIGGLDLGLERAGMRVAWQVEKDPYCRRVLAKHWPDVPCYDDVKELTGDELAPVDLICGGFPCQPVSRAGRRLAQADERWLWPDFARLVGRVRPRFVLVENVPGLLVHGMGDVLGDLARLGYDAEWESIPAAAVGALHIRDRVFIVGDRATPADSRTRSERRVVAHPAGYRDVADSNGERRPERRRAVADGKALAGPQHGGEVDDALRRRHGTPQGAIFTRGCRPELSSWWLTEPGVGRVARGVPARVDRLRALGNAVVPQVAEYVGRRILAAA